MTPDTAVALAVETDALNRDIARCEAVLAGMGLAVTAEVDLPSGGRLGFGKLDNAWRLYCTMDAADEDARVPLANTSRGIRVEATKYLGELHDALMGAVETNRREVAQARERIALFTSYLRK